MHIGIIGGGVLILGATAVFAGQTAAAVLGTTVAYGTGSAVGVAITSIPELIDGLNDAKVAGDGVSWDGSTNPSPSPSPPAAPPAG